MVYTNSMLEIKILGTTQVGPAPQEAGDLLRADIRQMLREAQTLEKKSGGFDGSLAERLNTILIQVRATLRSINPAISTAVLRPPQDMSAKGHAEYTTLTTDEKKQVDQVRADFIKQTEALTQAVQETTGVQSVVFEKQKRYYRQTSSRSCEVANYCSIYETVTGKKLDEQILLDEAKTLGLTEPGMFGIQQLRDSILNVLAQTATFQRLNPGISIRALPFFGCTFDDLASFKKKVAAVQTDQLSTEVHCRASIASEVVTNGIHDVILQEVTDDTVTVNDPSNVVGSEQRVLPKREFINRWGKGYFTGTLYIASKQ